MLPALFVTLGRERIRDVYVFETKISLFCSDDDSTGILFARVSFLFRASPYASFKSSSGPKSSISFGT